MARRADADRSGVRAGNDRARQATNARLATVSATNARHAHGPAGPQGAATCTRSAVVAISNALQSASGRASSFARQAIHGSAKATPATIARSHAGGAAGGASGCEGSSRCIPISSTPTEELESTITPTRLPSWNPAKLRKPPASTNC